MSSGRNKYKSYVGPVSNDVWCQDRVPDPQGKGTFGLKPHKENMQLQIADATWQIERKWFRLLPNYFVLAILLH